VRMRVRELRTPLGPGRAHLQRPDSSVAQGTGRGTVLLGHGAGAGVESRDLQALTELSATGWTVALLEQPWHVAGRRVASPPATLDVATRSMLAHLEVGRWALPRPWVLGGRSAGARVACRLAVEAQAAAVVALAFPLVPPGRTGRPGGPGPSRAAELCEPVRHGIPLLVVQGTRDRFGGPHQVHAALGECVGGPVKVCAVAGDHSPTRDGAALLQAVCAFLDALP